MLYDTWRNQLELRPDYAKAKNFKSVYGLYSGLLSPVKSLNIYLIQIEQEYCLLEAC